MFGCLSFFLLNTVFRSAKPREVQADNRTQGLALGCGNEAVMSEFSSSGFCVPHLRNGNGFFLWELT